MQPRPRGRRPNPRINVQRLQQALSESEVYNQDSLAREVNVAPSTLGRWIQGDTRPPRDRVREIEKRLGKPQGWLYQDDGTDHQLLMELASRKQTPHFLDGLWRFYVLTEVDGQLRVDMYAGYFSKDRMLLLSRDATYDGTFFISVREVTNNYVLDAALYDRQRGRLASLYMMERLAQPPLFEGILLAVDDSDALLIRMVVAESWDDFSISKRIEVPISADFLMGLREPIERFAVGLLAKSDFIISDQISLTDILGQVELRDGLREFTRFRRTISGYMRSAGRDDTEIRFEAHFQRLRSWW